MLETPRSRRQLPALAIVAIFATIVVVGTATAFLLPLGFLVIGLAVVVMSARFVEPLAVAMFWALPYMVINLPTGAFTLKLSEGVGYLFAIAALIRAFLRRDRWSMPPGTVGVLTFLAATLLSAACEPSVNIPFVGATSALNRNSPTLRSTSEILWMGISWLVVIAMYNVILRRKDLFPRCVAAHCLGGGLGSLVSLGLLGLYFLGFNLHTASGTGKQSVDVSGGGAVRLAGVAYEPMFLAVYLISVIPLTLVVYLLRPEWVPRRLSGTALILEVIVLFLSFSAGGFVGIIVALAIVGFMLRKVPKSPVAVRRLKIAAAVLGVMVCLAAIAISSVFVKLASVANKLSDTTGNNRHSELVVGFSEFEHFPLLGVGPGMTTYQFPKYIPDAQSQMPAGTYDVHNIILSTLGELGVVGFLALCFATFSGLRPLTSAIARYGPERVPVLMALTASLIGCAVQALSLDLSLLALMYFTGMLTLTGAAYAVEHRIATA